MLVSHQHQFIFTKTVKTGGTSIESYFEQYCMRQGEWQQQHARDMYISEAGIIGERGTAESEVSLPFYNHMPADLIRDRLPAEWSTYFKFCSIRNPYDKEMSAFYHFTGPYPRITNIERDRKNFENWIIELHEQNPIPPDRAQYYLDGKFCMDDFVRYETMQADIERICHHLSITWNPELLPRFKTDIRPINALTKMLYTDTARKVVAARHAMEIEYFGYTY